MIHFPQQDHRKTFSGRKRFSIVFDKGSHCAPPTLGFQWTFVKSPALFHIQALGIHDEQLLLRFKRDGKLIFSVFFSVV